MNITRYLRILFAFAIVLLGGLFPIGVALADTLYIGDGGDNTIKSFDADSGTFLWKTDVPGTSGLAGLALLRSSRTYCIISQFLADPVS
jgi:outer membrane protein assembly factor BamB